MIKTTIDKICYLKSEKIASIHGITHFFSTREGGVSKGAFRSLNFGTQHGESDHMISNLSLLKKGINHDDATFVIPRQTHSDVVKVVDEQCINDPFENTDALITNLQNVFICIKTADCVPILLVDPVTKVIGAVHAGWRGVAQNIVCKAIEKMIQTYGSLNSDIIAAIGPCIGPLNYEVGPEVIMLIQPLLTSPEKAIAKNRQKSTYLLNLQEANFQLITQAGIKADNIDILEMCTYTFADQFYSARRDGSKTGRMLNGIGIANNNSTNCNEASAC